MTPHESTPTFPTIADRTAERALRRDLLLIEAQRRPRRRGRRRR
jgi:hypothetical protein